MGALVAGVVFGLVPDRTKFYISAFCGLLGMLLTWLLVPDISGLDLSEGARLEQGTPCASHFARGGCIRQDCCRCSVWMHSTTASNEATGGAAGCRRLPIPHAAFQARPASAAGDRRWMLVLEGHGEDYHGEACNPKHLSVLEASIS